MVTLATPTVSLWAILVATIASTLLGMLWYGFLFKKQWQKLSGITEKQLQAAKNKGMAKAYIINFVATLVMAFVLFFATITLSGPTYAYNYLNVLFLTILIWLGFIATVMLNNVLWGGKPFKLYLIDVFYQLVSLVIMALIFVAWV